MTWWRNRSPRWSQTKLRKWISAKRQRRTRNKTVPVPTQLPSATVPQCRNKSDPEVRAVTKYWTLFCIISWRVHSICTISSCDHAWPCLAMLQDPGNLVTSQNDPKWIKTSKTGCQAIYPNWRQVMLTPISYTIGPNFDHQLRTCEGAPRRSGASEGWPSLHKHHLVIHQHLPVFNHQEKTRKGCCKCRQKGTSTESATVMLNGISTRFVPYITGISLVSASSTAVNLHLPPQNVGNLYPNGPNPVLTFSTGQLEMSLDTKLCGIWCACAEETSILGHWLRMKRPIPNPKSALVFTSKSINIAGMAWYSSWIFHDLSMPPMHTDTHITHSANVLFMVGGSTQKRAAALKLGPQTPSERSPPLCLPWRWTEPHTPALAEQATASLFAYEKVTGGQLATKAGKCR